MQSLTELKAEALYPRGDLLCPAWLARAPPAEPYITRQTPIVTLGSCFALEIRSWLRRHGYKVHNMTGAKAQAACTIFNTATLQQEFERVFGEFKAERRWWSMRDAKGEHLLDPHRFGVAWEDVADRQAELADYKGRLGAALTGCEVLILTVGQAEVWESVADGSACAMVPPDAVFTDSEYRVRLLTVSENVGNIERAYELFAERNAKAQVIVTVSPVPLKATFRGLNSLVADTEQKAILRAAVGEFAAAHPDRVTYFPSFEVVKSAHARPYKADNRHVTQAALKEIMQLFSLWFVKR